MSRRVACVVMLGLLVACTGERPEPREVPTTAPATSEPTTAQPTTTPTDEPTAAGPPARFELVAEVEEPLAMATRAGDPALYVAGKLGTIWAIRDGEVDPDPVLDLTGKVSGENEQGLLGLAFSPDGRFLYVNHTDLAGDTNVVEYAFGDDGVVPSSRRRVLFLDQPFPNHNGGNLVFGPDGYLYVGLGDGGSDYTSGDPQGDPNRYGQDLSVLFGKMLRIAPRTPAGRLPPGDEPYLVPPDNPFVGRPGARPEIWAYGLRHPWRYSFDSRNGDLWIGEVGAGDAEEIDHQRASSPGGENYGWNILEGTKEWRQPPSDAVAPVFEYPHDGGRCAVIGGFVYRGSAIPALRGRFVFADHCLGAVDSLRLTPDGAVVEPAVAQHLFEVTSFGQDADGELYVLSREGGIYRLVPA